MVDNTKVTGGKGSKREELPSMYATTTITGGDVFTRRVANDYSKHKHAEEDRQAEAVKLPDISLPKHLPF